MARLIQKRWNFVALWVLATAWLPVMTSVWGTDLRWPWTRAIGSRITTGLYVASALTSLALLLVALTQWPLLAGRVRRSWLWPLAGLAAVVLQHVLNLAFFDLYQPMESGSYLRAVLYIAAPTLAVGLAIATSQTLVLRYWRIGGWSWIVVCVGAFIFSNVAALFVSGIYGSMLMFMRITSGPTPLLLDVNHIALVSRIISATAVWLIFGCITGWLMYSQIAGHPVRVILPVWLRTAITFVGARLRRWRPLYND